MATSVFMQVTDPDVAVGTHPAVTLTDGVTEVVYQQLYIPHEFTSINALRVFVIGAGSGNMVASVATNWGQTCSEVYNNNTDSISLGLYPLIVNDITCIDVSAAFTGVVADDLVGFAFTRQGGHASDTVNASVFYLGLELVYN